MTILILTDNHRDLVKLCSDVRKNGYKAGAIVIGPKHEDLEYADIVLFIPAASDSVSLQPKEYARKVANLIVEREKLQYLLIDPNCIHFAHYLALMLGVNIITDISQINKLEMFQ